MLQLEGKDYDSGQFLQWNGLLTYLGDLNQAHNDLRDLVSKLQLQLENKDKRIKELEGKIQQNAISTDKRCKGIEITINNISKALAGIKGENIRIKEIQVPKDLKLTGDLPSSRTESKMGTISKEDVFSPRTKNDIVESSPKKSEPSKEEVKEDDKSKEEIKPEEIKEEPVIEEEKKEEPVIEEDKKSEQEKEEKSIEDNKEEEKNKEEDHPPSKEESIVETKKEEVIIPIVPPKQNPEEEKILTEGAKKSNNTISPEMISILFKKVKDNQTRIEALEKYTDTTVSTSKSLKHLDRNINNRVSNLEKTSKGKIDDCNYLYITIYSNSKGKRTRRKKLKANTIR